uniref:Uncharacterized protein n=1 Tax=Opuntia streptacantha TaxID=393608 RepID=A0A7C9D2U5_OPUST
MQYHSAASVCARSSCLEFILAIFSSSLKSINWMAPPSSSLSHESKTWIAPSFCSTTMLCSASGPCFSFATGMELLSSSNDICITSIFPSFVTSPFLLCNPLHVQICDGQHSSSSRGSLDA